MNTDPHKTPSTQSDITPNQPSGKWLARIGTILYAGPLIGLVGTIIGMIQAFSTLSTGSADPAALADDISIAMISLGIGVIAGLIGLIIVLIAFYKFNYRKPSFFWNTIALSIVWCIIIFPYGLIVGLSMLIVFCSRKNEFTNADGNSFKIKG